MVTGKLSSGTLSLLDVLQQKVEPSLILHGQNNGPRPQGWRRPFVETESAQRPPIQTTLKEIVEFPEKDESLWFNDQEQPHSLTASLGMGELMISFRGPPPKEFLERKVRQLSFEFTNAEAAISGIRSTWHLYDFIRRGSIK